MKNADPGCSRMRAVLVVYASRRGGSLFGLFRCPGTTQHDSTQPPEAGFRLPGRPRRSRRRCLRGTRLPRAAGSPGTGTSNPCAACMLADDPGSSPPSASRPHRPPDRQHFGEMPPAAASRLFGGSAPCRPGASRKASANLAREGRVDYLLVESTGISEPLPAAEPRLGRRTALTFPLLPPPQKN